MNPETFFGYISIIRILALVLDVELITLFQLLCVFSIMLISLFFYIVFSKLPGSRLPKIIILLFYPFVLVGLDSSVLTSYIVPFSYILTGCIIYLLLRYLDRPNQIENFALLLVCWFSLGLYWHTVQAMTLMIAIFTTILMTKINYKVSFFGVLEKRSFLIIFTMAIIFLATWFSVRSALFENILKVGSFSINLETLFSRGSVSGEHAYISYFTNNIIDLIRYSGMAIGYIILLISTAFIIIWRNKFKNQPLLIFGAILLLSDISFILLYLFATDIIGIRIYTVFSIPYLFIMLLSLMKSAGVGKKLRMYIFPALAIFLLLSIGFTSLIGYEKYYFETPQKNIPANMYYQPASWVTYHSGATRIMSDAHSTGNMLLNIQSLNTDQKYRVSTFTTAEYVSLYNSSLTIKDDALLVINAELFYKHLTFGSLRGWTSYEPIPPEKAVNNLNLNSVYTTNAITIFVGSSY